MTSDEPGQESVMGDLPDGVHEEARVDERPADARSPLAAFTTWLVLVVAFFVAGAVVRSVRAGSVDLGAMVVPTLIAAVVLGAWMVFRYRREA